MASRPIASSDHADNRGVTLLVALRHRSFAWLWSGQTISRLGDSLYSVALAWWVLQTTGSASAMGTVLIFSFAPMVIFLLIGGVTVDRLPRLRVMVVSDLASGLVVLMVAALAAGHRLEVWHVYVASMLFGFLQAFFFPAYNSVVPDLTPAEALPSANSLTGLSQQLAGIVGPAIGAGVVAAWGTPAAFAVNGLSFLVAAGCVLPLLKTAEPPRASSERGNVWRDLREGIGLVLRQPWLWITIAVFSLINVTLAGPRAVALPFLVERTLHAEVGTLGFLFSAGSAGAVLGAVWLGGRQRLRRRGLLAYGATVLSGLAAAAIGLWPLVLVAAVGSLIMGLCISVFSLVWTNTLQELVPREKLGRVTSIDALGSFVLLPLGFGLTGWATDRIGPPLVFVIGGAATALLALAAWLHPAIRHLD
jgi:MFS family permease